MTEKNEPAIRSEREKASSGHPDAADEIAILDYVMLDFIDEYFAPRKGASRRITTEPSRVS